jgi:hypothetical protein
VCLLGTSICALAGDPGFHLQDSDDKLEIRYEDQHIATYLKRHGTLTRPAFVNVGLPSGIQVTRNFPPRKPEDLDPGYSGEGGMIHPMMHPGIWISYGHLDGNDYWRLKARVEFVKYVEKPKVKADLVSFSVRNRYLSEDGDETVCTETVRYLWRRVERGIAIDIQATYRSRNDFYFGDQEESGLGVRVASPLRVNGGNGTILNNHGDKNGAEVWGKEAEWVDYFGTIDGKEVGVMIVPHKNNPRRSWMHARDYGLIVANPFPKQPKERKAPYVKTPVEAEKQYSFGWTVLLHEMPEGEKLDREKVARTLKVGQ